jgi:hypothetical protein
LWSSVEDSAYRHGWRTHTVEDTRVWPGGREVVWVVPIDRAEERRRRRPHWTIDLPMVVSASDQPLRLCVVVVGEWVGLSGHRGQCGGDVVEVGFDVGGGGWSGGVGVAGVGAAMP